MKRNNETRNRILKFLVLLNLILVVPAIISLLPFSKKNVEPKSKTALLNVNRIQEVHEIDLSQCDGEGNVHKIKLYKSGQFWTGTDSFTNTRWPADNQNVANLIDRCSQIITVSKAATSKSSWASFRLEDGKSFSLGFYTANGERISELFFGDTQSLISKTAFRTWKDETVYKMDSSISSYLNTSTSFWADPFVFPQAVTGYSRMQSETIIRHGAVVNFPPPDSKADYTFRRDFENGSSARFLVYKSHDQHESMYFVIPRFIPGKSASDTEKNAVERFDYAYTMSQWTLEKFAEEVQQQ